MSVPREGDSLCPTRAVVLVGRRGVIRRSRVSSTWKPGDCTWCGTKVTKPGRSTWCSTFCVDAFKATQPEEQRRVVKARDGGVCGLCGLDTVRFRIAVRRWWWRLRPLHRGNTWPKHQRFDPGQHAADLLTLRGHPTSTAMLARLTGGRVVWWDMDHAVPISEGGHPYDIRNLRTLCCWCHQRVTAEGSARRADRRRRVRVLEHGQGTLFGAGRPLAGS